MEYCYCICYRHPSRNVRAFAEANLGVSCCGLEHYQMGSCFYFRETEASYESHAANTDNDDQLNLLPLKAFDVVSRCEDAVMVVVVLLALDKFFEDTSDFGCWDENNLGHHI
mmetsp:Transcript_34432/g.41196  ORF Transcript_34432/g.41196 Transcript_34432/m.41196 type:complete len:112 (-) Transcript_34432:625-960(-)